MRISGSLSRDVGDLVYNKPYMEFLAGIVGDLTVTDVMEIGQSSRTIRGMIFLLIEYAMENECGFCSKCEQCDYYGTCENCENEKSLRDQLHQELDDSGLKTALLIYRKDTAARVKAAKQVANMDEEIQTLKRDLDTQRRFEEWEKKFEKFKPDGKDRELDL
jgi:hypothetical protein